jgi:hypothetical protein
MVVGCTGSASRDTVVLGNRKHVEELYFGTFSTSRTFESKSAKSARSRNFPKFLEFQSSKVLIALYCLQNLHCPEFDRQNIGNTIDIILRADMKCSIAILGLRRQGIIAAAKKIHSGAMSIARSSNSSKGPDRMTLFSKLLKYDNGDFDVTSRKASDEIVELEMPVVEALIIDLKRKLKANGDATDLFGKRHNDAIEGMVRGISMGFGGKSYTLLLRLKLLSCSFLSSRDTPSLMGISASPWVYSSDSWR